MSPTGSERFGFEGFTLDVTRGCVQRGGSSIDLRPKSFQLLCHLVRNAGRLIVKDEMMAAVWPGLVVTDESIARCVSDVRTALGDRDMRIVKTVPRRGYVFDVPVTHASDRPSIAVLPLLNLSGDAQQDYFSDGLTEDLITLLSSVPDLIVIARHSSFVFKDGPRDSMKIARELGVRYLLEGSLRSDGDRIRITTRLIEAETGRQLWAEHHDRARREVFSVQDEIAQRIVGSLVARVGHSELARTARKPPQRLAAYDYFLKGLAISEKIAEGHRAERIPEARRLLQLAIASDPNYARPLVRLARTYFWTWIESVDTEPLRHEHQNPATLEHAVSLVRQAIDLDAYSAEAHARLGSLLHWQRRRTEAVAEFALAFEIDPNLADFPYVILLTHEGRAAEAVEYMQRAKRSEPFYPPMFDAHLAHAHYLLGRFDIALDLLRVATRRLPEFLGAHVWHAATAAQLGLDLEAREAVANVTRLQPSLTIARQVDLVHYSDPNDSLLMTDGLRKAGLKDSALGPA